MKIYLVRHGESIGNTKQGYLSGQTDPEGLSEKGRIQIIRTAWDLKKEPIDAVFASPVARAQETAHIISSHISLNPKTLPFLTELHHGIFEGHYWWEMIHKIPPSWRAKREDFRTPYPKGESMEDLLKRVSDGLFMWIRSVDDNGTYILVSHQAVITTIRYCLEHGAYTEFADKKAEAAFLKFLHTVKLENGTYAVADYDKGFLKKIEEVSTFEPVRPNQNAVAFYAKTLLDSKTSPMAEHMITASANAAYRLSTPKHFMLKVIRDKDDKSFNRQIEVYKYLQSKQIAAPVVVHVDQSRTFFADDVIIQDYVEGDVIKNCFMDHPGKTVKLLQVVFEKLQLIHELPTKEVSHFWTPPAVGQLAHWNNYMTMNINMTLHIIRESSLKGPTLTGIQSTLSSLKSYVREEKCLTPIHGDVGSDNIIVSHTDRCNLVRIIDFEWARIGDPLWDFAYFWGWVERDNAVVAAAWKKILEKELPDQMIQLNWFRILFHAWTVRDMVEYKDHSLRTRRGQKSLEVLRGD